MLNQDPTANKKICLTALIAVTVALVSNGAGLAALAQGLEGGSTGGFNEPAALEADQDSLLPPEVVPLDPSVAARMSQSQAQARAAQMNMPVQAAPGMSDPSAQFGGMQTARQARQAAFDSLMNQSQAPPVNQSYQGSFAGGGQANNFGSMGNMTAGGPAPQGFNSPTAAQPQVASNSGSPQSNWVQPGQAGSQTLTGGVKNAPVRHDIRRGGFSNAMSAVAGLGTGLFLGSLVNRSYYSSPFGLGMFGLGLTGFGLRNGFRW